jgi:hypothetical protein
VYVISSAGELLAMKLCHHCNTRAQAEQQQTFSGSKLILLCLPQSSIMNLHRLMSIIELEKGKLRKLIAKHQNNDITIKVLSLAGAAKLTFRDRVAGNFFLNSRALIFN